MSPISNYCGRKLLPHFDAKHIFSPAPLSFGNFSYLNVR